jgi:hypothetical protein
MTLSVFPRELRRTEKISVNYCLLVGIFATALRGKERRGIKEKRRKREETTSVTARIPEKTTQIAP